MSKSFSTVVAAAGVLALATLLLWHPVPQMALDSTTATRATTGSPAATVVSDPTICDLPTRRPKLDAVLKDPDGKSVSLERFKGKVVLVDFWATWCAPCKLEIPGFVELYDRYKPRGLEMVGLLLMDSVKNVPAFAKSFGMQYPLLDASDRPDVEDAFGPIVGMPTSFLLAPDGSVCKTHLGYTPKEQFEAEIRALLHL